MSESDVPVQSSTADDAVRLNPSDDDPEYVLDPTPTPWRRLDVLDDPGSASRIDWEEHYNLHAQFLPWEHLDLHGFDALREVTEFLESRPPTSRRVSMSRIMSRLDTDHYISDSFHLEDFALLSGWWCGGQNSSGGPFYCNPNYSHGHDDTVAAPFDLGDSLGTPWEDSSRLVRRLDLIARATAMGLNAEVLMQPFGASDRRTALKWAHSHYVAYGQRKKEGQIRMARTWKTIHEWGDGDYTYNDIAEAFGVPRATVSSSIHRRAPDFEPPRDPNYREVGR